MAGAAFVACSGQRVIGRSRRHAKRIEGDGAGGTVLTLSLDTIGPHDFSVHVSKLSEGSSTRTQSWVAGAVKQSDVDLFNTLDRPWLSGVTKELLDEAPPKLPMSRGSTVVSTASGEQGVPILHVNFLFSSPLCYAGSTERLPPLSVHQEYSLVEKAWRHSCSSSSIRLDVSAATVDKFSSMATTPHALSGSSIEWWHLAAHAGPSSGSIILEDDDGCAHVQDANFFESSLCRPPFGALVLSCASERLGQALLQAGSAFVLVTRGSLRDSAARLFTEHFYRHLFAHWGNSDDCLAMVLASPSSSPASSSGDPLESPQYQTSFSPSVSADGSRTSEMLSCSIRAAFNAGKEALLRAAVPAIRAEAAKLELLEGQSKRPLSTALSCQPRGDGTDDVGSPAGGSSPLQTCPWTEYSVTGSSGEPCFGPHICEDFIGRAKELQQLIAHVASRRIVVLHGPEGHGKSALCAEFCRFVAAPGRKFSATRSSATGKEEWRHRLGYLSLQEVSRGEQDTAEVVTALVNVASELRGASCLVVDDAEPSLGWHDSIAIQLLRQFSALGLLLVRRRPLYRLEGSDRWKPVNLELGPLQDQEAARLFLARVHRPLFELDFTGGAAGAAARSCLKYEEVISRLPSHPALALCSGSPRRIAHLASMVTKELPSLLDVKGDALV